MKRSSILIYILLFIILIITICIFVSFSRPSVSDIKYPEGYYFKVEDENGVESCIHNSGIMPKSESDAITLSFLKKEINNGKELELSKPKIIYLGESPKSLNRTIESFSLDEDDWCYLTTFSL